MITHGVPQDSILGSMLFSLYMSDLPGVPKFSIIESYVGEVKICLRCSSQDIHLCLHQVSKDLRPVVGLYSKDT